MDVWFSQEKIDHRLVKCMLWQGTNTHSYTQSIKLTLKLALIYFTLINHMVLQVQELEQYPAIIAIKCKEFEEKLAEVRGKAEAIIKEYTRREDKQLSKEWEDYRQQLLNPVVRWEVMRTKNMQRVSSPSAFLAIVFKNTRRDPKFLQINQGQKPPNEK